MTRMGLLSLLVIACGASPDRTSYLLLDKAAREAGVAVTSEHWKLETALPVAVEAKTAATLHTASAAEALQLQPGSLGWIRGPHAQVDWIPLESPALVRGRLLLEGTEEAVRELARMTEAQMALRGLRFELAHAELLDRLSFANAAGISEAEPIFVELNAPPPVPLLAWAPRPVAAGGAAILSFEPLAAAGAVRAPLPARAEATGAEAAFDARANPALLVGRYQRSSQTLVLDASGRFRLGCAAFGCERGEGAWQLQGRRVVLAERRETLAWDGESELSDGDGRWTETGGVR